MLLRAAAQRKKRSSRIIMLLRYARVVAYCSFFKSMPIVAQANAPLSFNTTCQLHAAQLPLRQHSNMVMPARALTGGTKSEHLPLPAPGRHEIRDLIVQAIRYGDAPLQQSCRCRGERNASGHGLHSGAVARSPIEYGSSPSFFRSSSSAAPY